MRSAMLALLLTSSLGLAGDLPMEITTPLAPTPVKGSDNRFYLLYEINLTYVPIMDRNPVRLEKLEVLEAGSGRVIASYRGKELEQITRQPSLAPHAKGKTTIAAGSRAVLYPFVSVAQAADVPKALRHRFTFAGGTGPATFEADRVEVSRQRVPVVRPPLVGSGWLTANGLAVENHHRNDVIALNGRSALPQRFAVDWVQVDAKGSTRRPGADPARNESYYCYGAPMLAVAPGRVTEVVDRFKDNFPVGTMPTKFKAMLEAGGNYIALDLGHGLYGFYCHLQPGSAKVKVGDRVRPGQVLGLVGNSGASTEPHLHFHMVNGPHLVADEGVPYVFDTFYLQVSQDELPEESKGDELPVVHFDLNAPGRVRHKEMPLMNTITRFAE